MNGDEQEYNIDKMTSVPPAEALDFSEYEGRKAKIANIEVIELDSMYDAYGKELPAGQTIKLPTFKLTTESLGKIQTKEGEKDVFASELVNMKLKDDLTWGWSEHERAKIQKLYKRLGITDPKTNPKELIGKEVVVILRPGKDDTKWLGILV